MQFVELRSSPLQPFPPPTTVYVVIENSGSQGFWVCDLLNFGEQINYVQSDIPLQPLPPPELHGQWLIFGTPWGNGFFSDGSAGLVPAFTEGLPLTGGLRIRSPNTKWEHDRACMPHIYRGATRFSRHLIPFRGDICIRFRNTKWEHAKRYVGRAKWLRSPSTRILDAR